MANKNRTCAVCGRKYRYCPSCLRDIGKPTWMQQFCSKICKDTFKICTDYNIGAITKEQAQEQLLDSGIDLSAQEKYAPYIQRDLNNIFN